MSWLEKKVATALFGTPPTSTVEEALQNFLKVSPSQGFSCVAVYQLLHMSSVKMPVQQVMFSSYKFRALLNTTELSIKIFFFLFSFKIDLEMSG